MSTENRSYFFTAPRKEIYCNGRDCKEKYGGIKNYVNTNKGQSMFRLGFCKCPTCNIYFLREKIIGKKCPCCHDFLSLKPRREAKPIKNCTECGEPSDYLIRYIVESEEQTGVYKEIKVCWNCLIDQDAR